MKINKKDEEFIEEFINTYLEGIDLEFNKDNDSLERLNKKINSMLPNYAILFRDLNVLYKVFNEVVNEKKKKGYVFNESFKFFLELVFEKLYKNKVIDKTIFNELTKFLVGFNIESRKMGFGETAGAGLGF